MKVSSFPFIALGLGLFLMGVLYKTGATDPSQETVLPLLTVLIFSEFGCIVTAIGAFIGVRIQLREGFDLMLAGISLFCGMLSVEFLVIGVQHWPGVS